MRISKTIRLLLALAACLAFGAGLFSSSVNGDGGKISARDDAGAQAAFLEAYKVFTHPRCLNCHPAGDQPLQGDDGRPHFYRMRRGVDGNGVFAARCSNCHQTQNRPGEHSPPGAPHPLEEKEKQSEPRWHLPPAATPMAFEKRTPAQLCRQLLDKKQNGKLTPEQLLHHVSHDPLVLWGWNPGEGRTRPLLSHQEFVQKVKEWVDKGCACPN
ncbi:MAG: hypothetical protein ACREEM_35705 [Blastocatellia bacterium]